MIKFDEHGHLQPYSVSELSLQEFQAIFVDGLADKIHRQMLFENYLQFLEEVKKLVGLPFFQWVAGSFITTKEFPGDIDCVTFLPREWVFKNTGQIQWLKKIGKSRLLIDASFCPTCNWRHRFYEKFKEEESEFYNLYSQSRANEKSIRLPKGIIKINC